jgi:hypothetical protein
MPFHKPKIHSLLDSTHLVNHIKVKLYLVYEHRDPCFWWAKLLHKGYKHLYCIKFDGLFWIKMDSAINCLHFDVLPYDCYDRIDDVLKGLDCTYQYVETWIKPRYRTRLVFAPWSCVEVAKALLGIRVWWLVTPYQLYKYCEAHNG